MNLLIVDDEISSIRAVSGMLNRKAIGIDQCFTALSAQEARVCMEQNKVDILLCDIEMPQESGLDLLEWVNSQDLDICCIYMTCYAEFSYAQRAVSLGSVAYLLKPIDPEELEKTMVSAIQKRQKQEQMKSAHFTLREKEDDICQQFWLNLFYEEIPSNREAICREIEALHLPLDMDHYYCSCLVVVRDWGKDMDRTHRVDRYAVHNVVTELFQNEAGQDAEYLIIFPFGQHGQMCLCGGPDQSRLSACCRRFAERYLASEERYLKVRSVCYLGRATRIEEAAGEMECLMRMDNNHLKNHGISVHLEEREPAGRETDIDAKFEHWTNMLEGGQFTQAKQEVIGYLAAQEDNTRFHKRRFRYFLSGYAGMLIGYSERRKFPLNLLTSRAEDADCFERSDQSLDNMKAWVDCSLTQLERHSELWSRDPIRATKIFIQQHLSDELDMAQIADNVHLNQDYLSRIFKRETGNSIKSYVTAQRMDWARELLETSHLPIADVAYKVGYSNYTSFNRTFKKHWGTSPQSYRK